MAQFKCSKCSRTFGMAAHLARHVNALHGGKRKSAAKKSGRTKKRMGRPARRVGRPRTKVNGRGAGRASRLGLSSMSLEQLSQLILAARTEARRRISELEDAIA